MAAAVGVNDARIDVGGPGHRGGVAQVVGHLPDDTGDGALAGAVAGRGAPGDGQADRGQYGPVPGTEVLNRVVATGDLPEILIQVRPRDVVPAGPGPVHQQLVSAALAPQQAAHHGADLVLGHVLLTLYGPLGRIVEHELALGHRDVLLPEGG